MGQGVSLKEIVEKMNLKNLTPDVDLVEKYVQVPDINRPALQLSGYFDHFDSDRDTCRKIEKFRCQYWWNILEARDSNL